MADRSDRFVAHLTTTPPCWTCKHGIEGDTCVAFPNGIPEAILSGEVQHRDPFPGDNGIQYERTERTRE